MGYTNVKSARRPAARGANAAASSCAATAGAGNDQAADPRPQEADLEKKFWSSVPILGERRGEPRESVRGL